MPIRVKATCWLSGAGIVAALLSFGLVNRGLGWRRCMVNSGQKDED